MSNPRFLLTRWLPLVVWAILIFIGSSDLLAARHTSRFIVPFLRWLFGESLTAARAEFFHFLIRKGGHLSEYAVLCVLLWRALGSLRFFQKPDGAMTPRRLFPGAVVGAAFYAASDEFHQSFVPTRTASLRDVSIDTAGALLGLTFYVVVVSLLQRRQAARSLRPRRGRS